MKAIQLLVVCAALTFVPIPCTAQSTNQSESRLQIGPPRTEGTEIDPHIVQVRYDAASHIKGILDQMTDFLTAENYLKGKVKIVADDRTNILIILSNPVNMRFFNTLVRVLDVEVEKKTEKKETGQPTSVGDSSPRADAGIGTPKK